MHRFVGADLGGGACGQFLTKIQHGDLVGKIHHHIHVMLDQQHGGLRGHGADKCLERVDFGIGETLGGFIQDQQFGVHRQAHRDFQQALVAIGQRAGDLIGHVCKTHAGQCGHAVCVQVLATFALDGECDVIKHRQIGVDGCDLECIGDAARDTGMGGQMCDIGAVKQDRAGAGRDAPRQQADEGGFARTIGANQSVDFPCCQVEINILNRFDAIVMLGQPFGRQDYGSHLTHLSRNVPRIPLGANSTSTNSAAPTTNRCAVV